MTGGTRPAQAATPLSGTTSTRNPTAGPARPWGPGCDQLSKALRTVAQLARMGGKSGARYAGLTVDGANRSTMDRRAARARRFVDLAATAAPGAAVSGRLAVR